LQSLKKEGSDISRISFIPTSLLYERRLGGGRGRRRKRKRKRQINTKAKKKTMEEKVKKSGIISPFSPFLQASHLFSSSL
jgi:hypothetical protein